MRKIGILGGSFNPPHLGHLHLAEQARKRLGLNEVWLLVSPQNPHKSSQGMEKFSERFQQCEILAAPYPWLKVSDFEEKLYSDGEKAYTAHTLKKLKETMKEASLVWLMGAENLTHFHKWQNWEEILKTVPVVTFFREEFNASSLRSPMPEKYRNYRKKEGEPLHPLPNWRTIFMPPHEGRATTIRKTLKTGGKPPHLTHSQFSHIQSRGTFRGLT